MIKSLLSRFIIPMGIALICLSPLFVMAPPTAVSAADIFVGNESELTNAITNANGATTDTTIILTADIAITATLTISLDSGRTVTLASNSPNAPWAIQAGGAMGGDTNILSVTSGTLILKSVIIDGKGKPNVTGVHIAATTSSVTVTIEGNSAIRNTTMHGVHVTSTSGGPASTLNMTGGVISGNIVAYMNGGGGVCVVGTESLFNMSDGLIGVSVDNKGEVMGSANIAPFGNGGGVSVNDGSTFVMSGGTISGNEAIMGGGVSVDDGSTFVMYGGTISGNEALRDGGGVSVSSDSAFTMARGLISNNMAIRGGGVYNSGKFTIGDSSVTGSPIPSIRNNASTSNNNYGIYHDGLSLVINNNVNVTDTICLALDGHTLRPITLATKALSNIIGIKLCIEGPYDGAVVVKPDGTKIMDTSDYRERFVLSNGVAGYSLEYRYPNIILEIILYPVTVNGSYASPAPSGAGDYYIGSTITIDAGTRDGYTFNGWTVNEGGITLVDASSRSTTFSMPASDVTVTANWRAIPTTTTRPITTTTITTTTTGPTTTTTTKPTTPITTTSATTTTRPTTPTSGPTIVPTTPPTTWTTTPPDYTPDDDHWALLNLILCALGGILALWVAFKALTRKVDFIWVILAVLAGIAGIAGIAGVVVFLLTQDMSLPVAWVDTWTIVNSMLFVIVIIGVIIGMVLGTKRDGC